MQTTRKTVPKTGKNRGLAPASMVKLTLSAGHRITNGTVGAQYMIEVKRLLEDPMLLLV